jgi:hypothetical protein
MYSRSAKGGEKGDPNRNPWLAKMEHSWPCRFHIKVNKLVIDSTILNKISRFGSNENIFPVCQSFETFTWLTVSASKLNLSQISFYSLCAAIFNSPTYV